MLNVSAQKFNTKFNKIGFFSHGLIFCRIFRGHLKCINYCLVHESSNFNKKVTHT